MPCPATLPGKETFSSGSFRSVTTHPSFSFLSVERSLLPHSGARTELTDPVRAAGSDIARWDFSSRSGSEIPRSIHRPRRHSALPNPPADERWTSPQMQEGNPGIRIAPDTPGSVVSRAMDATAPRQPCDGTGGASQ